MAFSGKQSIDNTFTDALSVFAADVDGDGDTDVVGSRLAGEIAWWENTNGDGSAWTKHTVDDSSFTRALSVFAADVDGDGDTDILGADPDGDGGTLAWWENSGDGTNWTKRTIATAFAGVRSVFAADVDGDNDMDVLGAAETDGEIAWWENNNGNGTDWTKHSVDAAFGGAHSVFAADVDGNGDMDILGAALGDDDITWWENTNGDGTAWTEHTVDAAFDSAASVFAADVDGDGDMDVLGASNVFGFPTDGEVAWWENTDPDGDGTTWTEHTVDDTFGDAFSVFAADLDGDGDIDILGAARGENEITWWENSNGDGTVLNEHVVDSAFNGVFSVFAADVDGDGDTDILGAADAADEIAWWTNPPFLDADGDGVGDAIDECPSIPNPCSEDMLLQILPAIIKKALDQQE